jgi:DNA-directed RNA polymerase subunit alpha
MKEDIIEFLLNVKALRLRSLTDRPGRLLLDVVGARHVYVGDIQPSAEFEVVNPELYLATLDSPEARLCVEFYAQQGVGYKPATRDSDMPIGVIPVDAIFSPTRRFNYEVKPIHIGQETYDKLIFEVQTDGTISPSEAIRQSAQILIAQLDVFASFSEVLLEETREKEFIIPLEKYTMPVESLGLATSVLNCLRRSNITTVGEVTEKSDKELLAIPKFGPKALENVKECLLAQRITLVGEEEKEPPSVPSAVEEVVDVGEEVGGMEEKTEEMGHERVEKAERI